MKKLIFIFTFFSVLILTSSFVQAQQTWSEAWAQSWFGATRYLWVTIFGLPEEWMRIPTIIYNVIIPFIALFAVSLGFLRQLRIFSRAPNIEVAIAFCMAFATLPSHAFIVFVGWSLALMGGSAWVAFTCLFIGGIIFYSWGRLWGFRAEKEVATRYLEIAQKTKGEIEKFIKDEEKIRKMEMDLTDAYARGLLTKERYETQMMALREKMMRIEQQKESLMERLREIQKTGTI
jgi:uncharacterized protein YqgQ